MAIQTNDFKTKTMCINRKNPTAGNYWGIALDIGYSGVKGFSPNKVFCFPSYARKTPQQMLSLGTLDENNIQYRDGVTGDIWLVGASAIDIMETNDTKDSVNSLFGRNRYFSDMFLVIARVGMALGMLKNDFGSSDGKDIVVQTGLPPAYLKSDTPLIKEALAGNHEFSVKVGNARWVNYKFTLSENNIKVMPQPMGTLISISSNMDTTNVPEASDYFSKRLLIFDPGFGTLDVFNITKGYVSSSPDTFDDLGMKRVIQETSDKIFERYHTEIPVLAMQKYLGEGYIRCFDRKKHCTKNEPFADILEEESKRICMEALARIDNTYNSFIDHDYFVVTGGTGEAWYPTIKEYFKDMNSLTIVAGNQNDNLPFIFSNVRGYYIYLLKQLQKLASIK